MVPREWTRTQPRQMQSLIVPPPTPRSLLRLSGSATNHCNQPLDRVHAFSNLGVIHESTLSSRPQIDAVAAKALRLLRGSIRRSTIWSLYFNDHYIPLDRVIHRLLYAIWPSRPQER